MELLRAGEQPKISVTYPEAVIEGVVDEKTYDTGRLELKVGDWKGGVMREPDPTWTTYKYRKDVYKRQTLTESTFFRKPQSKLILE